MIFVQVTIVLRERLEAIGVEVSVETFEEDQGTAALGEDPFVSCKMVQTCRVSNTLHVVLHEHVLPQEQPSIQLVLSILEGNRWGHIPYSCVQNTGKKVVL